MQITIEAETGPVLAALDALGRQAPLALVRALNRTGSAGRTQAARTLSADVGLTQTEIRKSFRATSATQDNEVYELRITDRRVPAIRFGAEQTASGVDVRGGRASLPHAFLARMPSGHRGVFRRTGRFGRRGKAYLERIAEVTLPLSAVMDQAGLQTAVVTRVTEAFPPNLAHEIDFLARQHGFQVA